MPFKDKSRKAAYMKHYHMVTRAGERKRFVGVDGEGGTGADGRHTYSLLRVGDAYLYNPKGLSLNDCCRLLWQYGQENKGVILVSFFFNYDVSMMLKDENPERVHRVFHRDPGRHSWYVRFGAYEVDHIPGKRFAVRHNDSSVTVHDLAGFYQCSFVKALERWNIGTEAERSQIREGKMRRSGFSATLSKQDIAYNAREIKLLEELAVELRETCDELDLTPSPWEGAGCLASAMLRKHKVVHNTKIKGSKALFDFARKAYYGGRFEINRAGWIRDVREVDIASAYPSVMHKLPCMKHTTWRHISSPASVPPDAKWYVARVAYECPDTNLYGPFPCRQKDGSIRYPLRGEGWYWNPELEESRHLQAKLDFKSLWLAEEHCSCKLFDWVEPMYQERLALGKNAKGIVLKLGLNSLYGKFAQSVGQPRYSNPVWAGLITSYTRAKLLEVFQHHPQSDVVMFATDAVYLTTEPKFPTTRTKELGMYEHADPSDVFICKPGFYFTTDETKLKTRGISQRYLEGNLPRFETEWERNGYRGIVPIEGVQMFIGARQGLRLYKGDRRIPPEFSIETGLAQHSWQAGTWITRQVNLSFSPRSKRRVTTSHGVTAPYADSMLTVPYTRSLGMPLDPLVYEHPDNDELLFGMDVPDY